MWYIGVHGLVSSSEDTVSAASAAGGQRITSLLQQLPRATSWTRAAIALLNLHPSLPQLHEDQGVRDHKWRTQVGQGWPFGWDSDAPCCMQVSPRPPLCHAPQSNTC